MNTYRIWRPEQGEDREAAARVVGSSVDNAVERHVLQLASSGDWHDEDLMVAQEPHGPEIHVLVEIDYTPTVTVHEVADIQHVGD